MDIKKLLGLLVTVLCSCSVIAAYDAKSEAEKHLQKGDEYLNARQYPQAITEYDQAVELDPGLALAFNNRGLAKYGLEDLQGAIQDYDRAIALESEEVDFYYNRGLAQFYFGTYEAAVSDFSDVIRLKPKDADAFYMRGLAKTYIPDQDIQSACEDFEKAKQLGSKDAEKAILKFCTPEEEQ